MRTERMRSVETYPQPTIPQRRFLAAILSEMVSCGGEQKLRKRNSKSFRLTPYRKMPLSKAIGRTITSTGKALPLRRSKDPLLSSSAAKHLTLSDGSAFVIRAPPTSLPPTVPIPQHSNTSSDTAGPSSNIFFTPPALPFLLAPSTAEHLIPLSRAATPSPAQLTPDQVASLQSLRRKNPQLHTRSNLAKQFNISPQVVGTLGWGDGSEARRAEKQRSTQLTQDKELVEGKWGWKKAIAREERRRRRSLW